MIVPVVNEALKILKSQGIDEKYLMTHDIDIMKQRGIKYTPAIEIDGRLIIHGNYPGLPEMTELLRKELMK